jgi:hypothetical protein
MTHENEDETADALRRLAEGQHDSSHDDPAPSDAIIPMEALQNDPQPQRVRPATPVAPVESNPSPARPARPSRPAIPSAYIPEPPPAESTPIEQASPQPEEPAFVADEDEDDDVVVAPAPAPEFFIAKKPMGAVHGPSLQFRRTLIPILLTFGVALPATGIWWFTLGPESPIKVLGLFFPITTMVLGAMLLLLAVLNMAQVKRLMHKDA